MQSFSEIVDTIKKIKGWKTDDKVAEALDMTTNALRAAKSRNNTPFERVLQFCNEDGISTDLVFLKESADDEGKDCTPEEQEYLDKLLNVLRNPHTKKTIEENIDTFLKVPGGPELEKKVEGVVQEEPVKKAGNR